MTIHPNTLATTLPYPKQNIWTGIRFDSETETGNLGPTVKILGHTEKVLNLESELMILGPGKLRGAGTLDPMILLTGCFLQSGERS